MEVAAFCTRAKELFDESVGSFTIGPLVIEDSEGELHHIAVAPNEEVAMPYAFIVAIAKAREVYDDIEEYMIGIDTWQRKAGEEKADRVSALLIIHARSGKPSRLAMLTYDEQGNVDVDNFQWNDKSIIYNEYIDDIINAYSLERDVSSRRLH